MLCTIGVVHRRHLPALHFADAAMRVQDEDAGALADLKASIAALPVSPDVAPTIVACAPRRSSANSIMPRQDLHRHILEGERRSVKQLKEIEIAVELLQRRRPPDGGTARRPPFSMARRRSGGIAPSVKREMTASAISG